MTQLESDLAAFEDARRQFVDAMAGVPTEALTYLSPGDDYALGGLVTHVIAVLRRYGGILDAIVANPSVELDGVPFDQEMVRENERATDGLTAATRPAAMASMHALHEHVAATLAAVGSANYDRRTPVRFLGGDAPYPTGAPDIAGWLTGHYLEHIPHVEELLQAWRVAPTPAP